MTDPEIILEAAEATRASEIWSIGCTLIKLFSRYPVWNVDPNEDRMKIFIEKYYH